MKDEEFEKSAWPAALLRHGAGSYRVTLHRADDNGIAAASSTGTSVNFSGHMIPGHTYRFKVQAKTAGGESSLAVSEPLTIPGSLGTITGLTWNDYKLSWNPVTDAEHYNVKLYRDDSEVFSNSQLTVAEYDFTSTIHAKGAGKYYVEVEADYKVFGNTLAKGKSETITAYTVTFHSNGGSVVATQTVEAGKTAAKPADSTKEGYIFKGWTLDETAYDFTTAVTGNITLKAKWEEKQEPTEPTKPTTPDSNPSVPQSGDNSNMPLWSMLLFVGAAGAAVVILIGKKRYLAK